MWACDGVEAVSGVYRQHAVVRRCGRVALQDEAQYGREDEQEGEDREEA